MSPTSSITIPLRIELEYMLDQRRLHRDLELLTIMHLGKRTDAEVDTIAAILGLTVDQVLNERKLRRRLRSLATNISEQKVRELRAILGAGVRPPSPDRLERWIDEQVAAIQLSVERWLTTANAELATARQTGVTLAAVPRFLRALRNKLSKQQEARASNAVLELNTAIIEEVARNGGSSHYVWETERDSRVRPNHVTLEGTIQSWDAPPAGGGTKPGDQGHPGSGYGCRCVPQPLPGRQTILTSSRMSPLGV